MHSVTDRQTDRQTDNQTTLQYHDNSRSYCEVRWAKNETAQRLGRTANHFKIPQQSKSYIVYLNQDCGNTNN